MAAEECDTRSSESVRACHQKIFIKYMHFGILENASFQIRSKLCSSFIFMQRRKSDASACFNCS